MQEGVRETDSCLVEHSYLPLELSLFTTVLTWNILGYYQACPSCPLAISGAEHFSHSEGRAVAPAGQATKL